MLDLTVPGTDHYDVYCQIAYGVNPTNREPSGQIKLTLLAAMVDSVPGRVGDESYMPTLYVEPMVWESIDE